MSLTGRIMWIVSACLFIFGLAIQSVVVLGLSWIILYIAAILQDRHNRT